MSGPHSLLVVSAAPDARASTGHLATLVSALDRREDTEVEVWFLRSGDRADRWPSQIRVVDDLRRWPPAALAERLHIGLLASFLRGRLLRSWRRSMQPDVVLLDDGVGDRVLDPAWSPVVVVRENAVPPADLDLEAPPRQVADVVLGVGASGIAGRRVVCAPWVWDLSATPEAPRGPTRAVLGLPDAPLVAGWSVSDETGAVDRFMRALWSARSTGASSAHGVWFGHVDRHTASHVEHEAARMGLAGVVHLRSGVYRAAAAAADAVLIPEQGVVVDEQLAGLLFRGVPVVTYAGGSTYSPPGMFTIGGFDAAGAGDALVTALRADRSALIAASAVLDAGGLADALLRAVTD